MTLPRKTFAIISHPDAGKTTLTEKMLLYGGAIQLAGTVKGRKASRHATSDWMALEKQRGISVTSSVMQFQYNNCLINLLDTPGHADFSEDTYRTLSAVDAAMMVIDGAKGVEARTIKLMDVCRMRHTPITTFINKMDRDTLDPLTLLDEVEKVLGIVCVPMTWPLGMGKEFKGVYHLETDEIILYNSDSKESLGELSIIKGLTSDAAISVLGDLQVQITEEIELVKEASASFSMSAYLSGEQTPVYFGSAIHNFGIKSLLDGFVGHAPLPQPRDAQERRVAPNEEALTGFVFKIQANMDPKHRDRLAFFRIVSGQYRKGMSLFHVRTNKNMTIHQAHTFLAGERMHTDQAIAGDIIGIHNHGTIKIGDTFTEGESLNFKGIPNFAPELFKMVRLKDPLKQKALLTGLIQLSEEGATQVFRPLSGGQFVLGAVGTLQFDVVAYRLAHEYRVECGYQPCSIVSARWVLGDQKDIDSFTANEAHHLALDAADVLTYLAPSMVSLEIIMEQYPKLDFVTEREHHIT